MPLKEKILKKIKKNNGIGLDEYLKICLYDQKHGYYFSQNVIGRDGDFITAPEISQIFGELIGLFIINEWIITNKKKPLQIIEFGPGKGTLASDIIRTINAIPFLQNIPYEYYLVEISPFLKKEQEKTLENSKYYSWIKGLHDIKDNDGFHFIIANEFFDALPIKQHIKNSHQKKVERKVIYDEKTQNFMFDIKDDQKVYEYCPMYKEMCDNISNFLAQKTGAMLAIDYGDFQENRTGSTIQGMKNHHYAPIFDNLGSTDISHQVDFYTLSKFLSKNFHVSPIETQEGFLQKIGIEKRMNQLLQYASSEQKMNIISACTRLISPQHMGQLFKVLFAKNYD